MKKKIFTALLCCLLAIGCFVTGALAASNIQEIKAYINHDLNMKFDDVAWVPTEADGTPIKAVTYNGRTYLPVRALGEKMGIAIDWDANTQTVYIGKRNVAETPATKPEVPVTKPEMPVEAKTLGELEAKGYKYIGYAGFNGVYTFIYAGTTRSYDVVVDFTESAKQAMDDISIFDDDYEQKSAAIRSSLVILSMESRNKAEPLSEIELAKYNNQKASALIDAGFELAGYSGTNGVYTFTFRMDKQDYDVVLDDVANEIMENKEFGDDSYETEVLSCTITSVKYACPC